MSTQEIRSSRNSKVYDEIARAGAILNGAGQPSVSADPDVINATNYTTYVDDNTGDLWRKESSGWVNTGIIVGEPGSGPVSGAVNVGAGTGEVYFQQVGSTLEFKRLDSTSGTLDIVNNVDYIDLNVIGGGVKNNYNAVVPPGVSNDSTENYEPGSVWIFLSPEENRVYTCVDSTAGAAKWEETNNTAKPNSGPPSATDDESAVGVYQIGDFWLDTLSNNIYQCRNNATGSAKWMLVGGDEERKKWEVIDAGNPPDNESFTYRMEKDGSSVQVKSNYDADNNNTIPGSSFDVTQGYEVGSRYKDLNEIVWHCLDNSAGQAIWSSDMGAGAVFLNFIGPTISTDAQLQYFVSSDATGSLTDTGYIGNNYESNRDPLPTDDNTKGYSSGSNWWNIILKRLWIRDDSIGASGDWVWINNPSGAPPAKCYGSSSINVTTPSPFSTISTTYQSFGILGASVDTTNSASTSLYAGPSSNFLEATLGPFTVPTKVKISWTVVYADPVNPNEVYGFAWNKSPNPPGILQGSDAVNHLTVRDEFGTISGSFITEVPAGGTHLYNFLAKCRDGAGELSITHCSVSVVQVD